MNVASSVDVSLPVMIHLDLQGPPVSYAQAASQPLQKEDVTPEMLQMCDIWEKGSLQDKEKVATQAIIDCIE